MKLDLKNVLKQKLYQNIPLGYDEAYELGAMAVEACKEGADPTLRFQTIAALSAMHNKATYSHVGDGVSTPKSAAEQIAGLCAAIFCEDIAKSPSGFIQPKVALAMDNCGMGGDLVVTSNVSTLAALIAASAGIVMCKHGSPANADAGRHGSSDFIELCGIDPFMTRDQIEYAVEHFGFAYSEALDTNFKLIHLQTHRYAMVPHVNDLVGPITNPTDPLIMRRRILGVNHLVHPQVVADAYRIMNAKGVTNMEKMFVVRGKIDPSSHRGFDELSTCVGGNDIFMLRNGKVTAVELTAESFGIPFARAADISPPTGMSKGEFSSKILYGEEAGAARDMVLANAALLFMLNSDNELSPHKAYEAARDTLASGLVPNVVTNVRQIAPQKAVA